ncbi:MAG: AMP-binding protein, partial [Akkermansia sp.]
INDKLDSQSSQDLIDKEGIKRFLTDKSTSRKLRQHQWVNARDFVYVDSILKEVGGLSYRLCYYRAHKSQPERLIKWVHAKPRQLDDEALLLFSKGQEDGIPKATSISQRNLLAQLLQLQQQLPFASLKSTLSSHPYYSGIGLFLGLLLPLISGQTIITYPIENKLEHLIRLIDSHSVELAFTSPNLLHQLLSNPPDTKATNSLRYLISSGALLNASLREKVESHLQVKLLNAYTLTESGALVCIEQEAKQEQADALRNKQQNRRTMCPVGHVLLGTALRIGKPYQSDLRVATGELGSLWLKGPSIAHAQQEWVNTGDIASMNEAGLVSIEGRRRRFSRIGQELISHEAVEQLLYRYFRLATNQGRKLAVIGINIKGQERLVMLSAAHTRFEPNDQVTMRYGLSNMKYPFSWSPSEVILVRPIPQLSNGQLDYKQCCQIAYQALGVDIPVELRTPSPTSHETNHQEQA